LLMVPMICDSHDSFTQTPKIWLVFSFIFIYLLSIFADNFSARNNSLYYNHL
jgi:hypothetical protein